VVLYRIGSHKKYGYVMSMHASVLVDSVGPPSAEFNMHSLIIYY
jgi:hypothetical protein